MKIRDPQAWIIPILITLGCFNGLVKAITGIRYFCVHAHSGIFLSNLLPGKSLHIAKIHQDGAVFTRDMIDVLRPATPGAILP